MKKSIFKLTAVLTFFVLAAFTTNTKASVEAEEAPGGGFTCPQGDKYKCAEKNGWTLYKGEGTTPVT